MGLRLSPEDKADYARRSEAIYLEKQARIAAGDANGAQCCRVSQSALYNYYAARQLPPEPEPVRTLANRVRACLHGADINAMTNSEFLDLLSEALEQ